MACEEALVRRDRIESVATRFTTSSGGAPAWRQGAAFSALIACLPQQRKRHQTIPKEPLPRLSCARRCGATMWGLVDPQRCLERAISMCDGSDSRWRTREVRHAGSAPELTSTPLPLRAIARKSKDGPQARRLLALAAIYEGATRTEAARIGGVTLQIVRDWVVKFNAHGPEGLIDRKPPGQPSRLTDAHRAALVARLDEGPIPAVHGVVRWRLVDLIAVALGGVPHHDLQADAEPRVAGHGLSQALGPSAPSRQERGGGGRF